MIPASLPICVFFTLYAVAGTGFFVAQHAILEQDGGLRRGDLWKIAAWSALWPPLALIMVVVFVWRGARA